MADPQQIQGLPEGATVGQPVLQDTHIQGLPEGAVVGQPVPQSGNAGGLTDDQLQEAVGGKQSGLEQFATDTMHNLGAGALETLEGGVKLAHKGIHAVLPEKVANVLSPREGMAAQDLAVKPHTELQGSTAAKIVGYGGENLVEFMLGDEALKGMSMAEKMKNISSAMKIFESSPALMKAVQTGANIVKAMGQLGSKEQEALKASPLLARLVSAGMDAVREATVAGAQKTAKTGDVKEGGKEAATQGAVSTVLGLPFAALGRAAEKAGQAGKAVKEGAEVAQATPTKNEIARGVASAVQDAESQMHSDFETGIQNLKNGPLKGKTVEFQGSPLQQAANTVANKVADSGGTLGKAFGKVAGGTEDSKNLLLDLTDHTRKGPLSIDELIQHRQTLGQKIGQITSGQTTAAERADVDIYRKLRDGIDDTIEKLSKDAGSPQASQDYAAVRQAYKDKVSLFQEPIIKSLLDSGVDSETSLDNAAKQLFAGKNKIDKINTLEKVIGKDALKQFGQSVVGSALKDASSASGQLNPAKFAKQWKEIDALPPEVKNKLFDMGAAKDGLDKIANDVKTAANYQRLVRSGVLSGAGLLNHWALLLGVLGHGDFGKASDLLDMVANRPAMWSLFRGAGKAGAAMEKSASAARVGTAVKRTAGSALSNVLKGANEPLGQDESGVWTNQ